MVGSTSNNIKNEIIILSINFVHLCTQYMKDLDFFSSLWFHFWYFIFIFNILSTNSGTVVVVQQPSLIPVANALSIADRDYTDACPGRPVLAEVPEETVSLKNCRIPGAAGSTAHALGAVEAVAAAGQADQEADPNEPTQHPIQKKTYYSSWLKRKCIEKYKNWKMYLFIYLFST